MFRTKDANGNVKYANRSKAIVIDNRDPLNKGRIIVDHPLLGNTVWIDYIREPGIFSVPSIGDVVFVECDAGEYEFPVASGIVTRGEDANPRLPSEFKRDIPTNRGFFTPGGHFLEFDDGEATITLNPDDTQFTTKNRGIRITSKGGNKIHIAEDPGSGNEFILIENNKGKIFKLTDKQILGQGTEHIVLGDTLFTMLDTFLTSVISGIAPGSPGQNAASLIAIKTAATTLQGSLPTFKSPNSFTD